MKTPIKLSLVVALSATVSACDTTTSEEKPAQRDVYTSMEDCIADWGDSELCERQAAEARAHAEKMASNSNGAHASNSFIPLFFGPSYYGDNRAISRNGSTVAPATSRATSTASYFASNPSKGTVYSAPKNPTPSATPVSRSGFGATGVARGGGSASS